MNEQQMADYLEQAKQRVYSRTHKQNRASAKRVLTLIATRTLEVNHNENDPRVIHAREYLEATK